MVKPENKILQYIIMPAKKVKKVGRIRLTDRKKSGGLNKTEKKETKQIVENAIKKDHVLKYFDSESNEDAVSPATSSAPNAMQQVSVIAYSSTTEFDDTNAEIKYGRQSYQPLYLTRPFKESNTNAQLEAQKLNSQYCIPKIARTNFSIERVSYVVESIPNSAANPVPSLAHSLPISYRIIKFGFKSLAGTQNDFDPNVDLFIDSHGQPFGIDSEGFSRLNCKYAPINSKKYEKKMDIQGTLEQGLIASPNNVDVNYTSDIVTGKKGRNLIHMTVPFKLSRRKGGKLFYSDPQAAGTKTSDSGGQREILAFHFWYDNGHNRLGGTNQPEAPTNLDIQIKTKSTSAFVDAQ